MDARVALAVGPDTGSDIERIARGGNYIDDVEATATWRMAGHPDGRNANVGFRLVRTAR